MAKGNASSGNENGACGTSHRAGPDECAYVSDLEYCGSDSAPSVDGTQAGSAPAAECTNAKGTCGPPGQQKKAAAMLAPYSSYYGFREVLQLLNGDSPYR